MKKNGKMLRCALLPLNALPGAERLTSVTPSNALVPTGFRPTGRSRVEMDVQLGSGAQALFCSRFDGGNRDFFSVMHDVQAGTLRYDYGTKPGGYNSYGPVSDYTRYVITMGRPGFIRRRQTAR